MILVVANVLLVYVYVVLLYVYWVIGSIWLKLCIIVIEGLGLNEISSFICKREFGRNKNLCEVIMWNFVGVLVDDLKKLKYVWSNYVKFLTLDLVLTTTNYAFGSWKCIVSVCLCCIFICVLSNWFSLVKIMHYCNWGFRIVWD